MTENVLILGSNSTIGRALCHVMAQRGCNLILSGRNSDELERNAADIRLRYQVRAYAKEFDALQFDRHAKFIDDCLRQFDGNLTGAVLCYGSMSDPHGNADDTRRMIETNFVSVVGVMDRFADYFESQKRGCLAAISSVAGDRGRQSNYLYGATKAGLTAYLSGLRNRLHPAGVHVLTVKPGFVDTSMTYGLLKHGSPLVASAEQVARDIDKAILRQKNVLYTPWFWSAIMSVICSIPESLFKRLRL